MRSWDQLLPLRTGCRESLAVQELRGESSKMRLMMTELLSVMAMLSLLPVETDGTGGQTNDPGSREFS